MKSTRLVMAVAALSMATGCAYGLTASAFPPSSRPDGVTLRVRIGNTEYLGELLETRDDAFLLLTRLKVEVRAGVRGASADRLVRLLPHASIRSATIELPGSHRGLPRWSPGDRASIDRFRLISRFPQGLPPDLLRQLLDSCGQTAVAGTTS